MLSIKRRRWMGRPASHATLRYYANHWRTLAAQFRETDLGLTLRYEDFISDPTLRAKLLDYLEIGNHPPQNFIENSKVDWTANVKSDLTRWERTRLLYWLSDEMKRWDY